MFTIFANIRINSETRLKHLQDSFCSFYPISDNWLINVRGNFRLPAIDFLKNQLGSPQATFFELLDDARGWTKNALKMIGSIKHPYLLTWNEDHLNIAPLEVYKNLAQDLEKSGADYLQYSWWNFGELRRAFDHFPLNHFNSLDALELTRDLWVELKKYGHADHLISFNGIFKKEFFKTLLLKDKEKIAFVGTPLHRFAANFLKIFGVTSGREKYFHFINQKVFKNRLSRFSKETPFNLERDQSYNDILPFKLALPKQELFACIDDDGGMEPGYQLIKRGLYPLKPFLTIRKDISPSFNPKFRRFDLNSGAHQDFPRFYEDVSRIEDLLIQTLMVEKGSLLISAQNQKIELKSGEAVDLYSNLHYKVEALEKSTAFLIPPKVEGKKIIYPKIKL